MTGPTNKSKERKHEILKAAQELFNTRGFQDTSVNDIMKKVGVAKGVFYYYFKTKDQVLDTLVSENIMEIAEAMEEIVQKSDIDALQKLKFMLAEEFKASMKSDSPDNHLHNIKNVDMHQRVMVAMVEILAPIIARVVDQGIKEGIFKTEYSLEVCEIVISGIHFITDLGIFQWDREQYLKRVRASEELIEKALGIKQGSFAFLSDLLKDTPDRINGIKSTEVDLDET
ncbi:MAG: TetR/AcrR family transcriptional regulator [Clostridia bacterium]|nr:TetR/AcrR family transcriptional regulator [Clostridia bacterium]